MGARFICELHRRLATALTNITDSFVIVFVEDAGPDESWAILKELAVTDARVIAIQLSRNFGQHAAISAGLDAIDAEWFVVMDCDLQDPPEAIPGLYHKAKMESLDVVIAERTLDDTAWTRRTASSLYNLAFSKLSGLRASAKYGNFRIVHRNAIEAFRQLKEQMRLFPAIMEWIGFKIGYLETHRSERPDGASSYSFGKFVRVAADAIVAYSDRPLHISLWLGSLITVIAFAWGGYIAVRTLADGSAVPGWASLAVLVSFIGGLQLSLLGVLGIYLGRVFRETKRRPHYIIREVREAQPGARRRN